MRAESDEEQEEEINKEYQIIKKDIRWDLNMEGGEGIDLAKENQEEVDDGPSDSYDVENGGHNIYSCALEPTLS